MASERKPHERISSFESWNEHVPVSITNDPVWRMTAYQLSVFASDIGSFDVTRLSKDSRTIRLAGQMYEALGSVGANICEGYSRGTGRDRARFYEYALGSGRESRHGYYKSRYSNRRYLTPTE